MLFQRRCGLDGSQVDPAAVGPPHSPVPEQDPDGDADEGFEPRLEVQSLPGAGQRTGNENRRYYDGQQRGDHDTPSFANLRGSRLSLVPATLDELYVEQARRHDSDDDEFFLNDTETTESKA